MFSRIDLCLGYYQIRIVEGHKENIVYHTRYGSYKFLMMLFGLTNAPVTFCTLMNNIFQDWLDDFMSYPQTTFWSDQFINGLESHPRNKQNNGKMKYDHLKIYKMKRKKINEATLTKLKLCISQIPPG